MKNILIVDDNRDLADGLAMLLENDSNVTISYNGTEALNFLAVNDYDLVLLDVSLPDINGVEIYCQIKEKTPGTSVLMMTGYRIEQLLHLAAGNKGVQILRQSLNTDEYMSALGNVDDCAITLVVSDLNAKTSIEEDLNAQGKDVCVANTRKDVQEFINKRDGKNILVLNLNETVMCGLKTFRDLVASDRQVSLVIVINDFHEEAGHKDVLSSLETTGCIFKPFDFQMLYDVINNELQISSCA
ncbi:MAG: response regulator [Gammaproteobacteria bacterium]|nr:response regulator [Gammaproteobacteria bacterium]MCK5091147.1 response regulator [Gammaproteobacteria bacterium]